MRHLGAISRIPRDDQSAGGLGIFIGGGVGHRGCVGNRVNCQAGGIVGGGESRRAAARLRRCVFDLDIIDVDFVAGRRVGGAEADLGVGIRVGGNVKRLVHTNFTDIEIGINVVSLHGVPAAAVENFQRHLTAEAAGILLVGETQRGRTGTAEIYRSRDPRAQRRQVDCQVGARDDRTAC